MIDFGSYHQQLSTDTRGIVSGPECIIAGTFSLAFNLSDSPALLCNIVQFSKLRVPISLPRLESYNGDEAGELTVLALLR